MDVKIIYLEQTTCDSDDLIQSIHNMNQKRTFVNMVTKLRSQKSRRFLNLSNNTTAQEISRKMVVINHAFHSLSRKILWGRTMKRNGQEKRSEEKRRGGGSRKKKKVQDEEDTIMKKLKMLKNIQKNRQVRKIIEENNITVFFLCSFHCLQNFHSTNRSLHK
jgi:hypothetical protein